MKNRYIVAREEVCIGCRLCEVACVVEHSETKDIIKAYKVQVKRPHPRSHVEEVGAVSISITCRHCDNPRCAAACITGAMVKREDGRVTVEAEKCVGCWSCVMACPYGSVEMDKVNKKSAKCDLCPDREIPACVEACPNRALIVVEEEAG